MKKKEYVAYINDNIILEVAYTEKGTVTKSSVAYALAMARAEAPVPEAYADDYAELKVAYELAKKLEDSTKLMFVEYQRQEMTFGQLKAHLKASRHLPPQMFRLQ